MKKIFGIFTTAALALSLTVSCTDVKKIEKDFDSLENRVTMLETVIPALNKNVEALKALMDATTINKVEEKDGTYTITLSNGETITLTQGSIGVGNTPVVSIDKDGFWTVDYGKGAENIKVDGQNVPAKGQNGITPKFNVDAEGFWQISYDGGKVFEQVKDVNGQPVKAIAEGAAADQFFTDVQFADGKLTVVLKSGETVKLPVVPSFLCAIQNAEGVQSFKSGESKEFNVELKGVASTIVTAPAGWTAVLKDAALTVTAPVQTKALIADTKSDVAILATSAEGFATIAKLSVTLGEAPVIKTPVATVTAGTATANSVSFTVALSDATTWKYLLKKSAETVPAAEEIIASGIEGTSTTVEVTELEAETEYALYVLPFNGTKQGEVASAKLTTLAAPAPVSKDLYQNYMDGKDIEIAGNLFNKSVYGEPLLLTSDVADKDIAAEINEKNAVIFLDGTGSFAIKAAANIKGNVILVGRYADKQIPLSIQGAETNVMLLKGILAMKNIVFSKTNAKYLLNNGANPDEGKPFEVLAMENCTFAEWDGSIGYLSNTGASVRHMAITNCKFNIETAKTNVQLFNFKSLALKNFKTFKFDNNIVWSSNVMGITVFNFDHKKTITGAKWEMDASLCNNTFVNIAAYNVLYKFYQTRTLKMNRNLCHVNPVKAPTDAQKRFFFFAVYSADQPQTGFEFTDNYGFGLHGGADFNLTNQDSKFQPSPNVITKLEASPFATLDLATGTFTQKAEYAQFGAQPW